jgi:hypothetical protein
MTDLVFGLVGTNVRPSATFGIELDQANSGGRFTADAIKYRDDHLSFFRLVLGRQVYGDVRGNNFTKATISSCARRHIYRGERGDETKE